MAPFVAAWADATLFWVTIISTQAPEARAKIFQGLIPGEIRHLRDDRIAFTGKKSIHDLELELRFVLFHRTL